MGSEIAEALKLKTCAIEHLDLSHNRMNEQVKYYLRQIKFMMLDYYDMNLIW